MICERCHAGQLVEYQRQMGGGGKTVTIKGTRCDRCGFTELENDDDIWSAVGL
ncbi:MAG: hypothetical protein ABSB56_05540 [Nitrososphaerales archaeon]